LSSSSWETFVLSNSTSCVTESPKL
jgi:hypothetical protein